MLDRASTFAQPQIVTLLKTRCVPVALDQAYQRRQQDTEGEFYRKIAGQSQRNDFTHTTQGFYLAAADGRLMLYNNNRDPDKLLRLLQQQLAELPVAASNQQTKPIDANVVDPRYNVNPPEGGLVVRVNAKVLGGYAPTRDKHQQIFHNSLSRDNLWITKAEHEAIAAGKIPERLQRRIARFHLVDNTRGEPPMWKDSEVRFVSMMLKDDQLSGKIRLQTEDDLRGFEADLIGHVETKDDNVVRFDVVATGDFWGSGQYTRKAPDKRFPLAVRFTLADGTDTADTIPPQGSRGWITGYLKN